MHVGTVVAAGAETSDVKFTQLLLLGQLDVMAEVAVVPLVVRNGQRGYLFYFFLKRSASETSQP